MRVVTTILIVIALAVLAAAVLIYSGVYNVAATEPHTRLTQWVLHATMRYSVERRARDITAPPLDDPARIREGFQDYHEMCQPCHGGPGVRADEVGQGLMPPAPDLTKTAGNWTTSELFWIAKHGVRMTGMPAWGPTHEDPELWSVVAFVRRLPTISAEDYQAMAKAAEAAPHQHGKEQATHSR